MVERTPQTEDKYVVRFPDGMRDRLKKEAENNGRSMNAEIVKRLQDTLDFDDHVAATPAPRSDEFDAYGPTVTAALSKSVDELKSPIDQVLQELQKLQLTITSLRVSPEGELSFSAEPKIHRADTEDKPLPAPTDEDVLRSLADRLGYEIRPKSKRPDYR